MKFRKAFIPVAALALFLSGCSGEETSGGGKEETKKTAETDEAAVEPADSSSEKTSEDGPKTISGRELLFEFKQTAKETPIRDQKAAETIKDSKEIMEQLGGGTPEVEEQIAVQGIEGAAVIEAIEEVYGSTIDFDEYGVLFFTDQTNGDEENAIWAGFKSPDDKTEKVRELLQKQIDDGKILAKYIHFFKSPYTANDAYALQDQVSNSLNKLLEASGEDSTYALSVDIITGDINLQHEAISDATINQLKAQYPGQTFQIESGGKIEQYEE